MAYSSSHYGPRWCTPACGCSHESSSPPLSKRVSLQRGSNGPAATGSLGLERRSGRECAATSLALPNDHPPISGSPAIGERRKLAARGGRERRGSSPTIGHCHGDSDAPGSRLRRGGGGNPSRPCALAVAEKQACPPSASRRPLGAREESPRPSLTGSQKESKIRFALTRGGPGRAAGPGLPCILRRRGRRGRHRPFPA